MSSTVVEKKMKYHLKVYVNHTSYERDEEDKCKRLVEKYQEAISKHNDMVFQNNFPDSGFDIYVPFKTLVNKTKTTKINMNIVAVMYDTENNRAVGYTMYPRSSISKTVLRLANNVGIIDSGYRGNLMGVFLFSSQNSSDSDRALYRSPHSGARVQFYGDLSGFRYFRCLISNG